MKLIRYSTSVVEERFTNHILISNRFIIKPYPLQRKWAFQILPTSRSGSSVIISDTIVYSGRDDAWEQSVLTYLGTNFVAMKLSKVHLLFFWYAGEFSIVILTPLEDISPDWKSEITPSIRDYVGLGVLPYKFLVLAGKM